jgi:hypothetical protein
MEYNQTKLNSVKTNYIVKYNISMENIITEVANQSGNL